MPGSGADPKKVLKAFGQLKGYLPDDQSCLLALVPETYAHLLKMADSHHLSAQWIEALGAACGVAADNAEKIDKEQEEFVSALKELKGLSPRK